MQDIMIRRTFVIVFIVFIYIQCTQSLEARKFPAWVPTNHRLSPAGIMLRIRNRFDDDMIRCENAGRGYDSCQRFVAPILSLQTFQRFGVRLEATCAFCLLLRWVHHDVPSRVAAKPTSHMEAAPPQPTPRRKERKSSTHNNPETSRNTTKKDLSEMVFHTS